MRVRSPNLHGAVVSAPSEEFALGESPPPEKVAAARGNRVRTAPSGTNEAPGGLERLFGGVKIMAGLAVVVLASSAVAFSLHRYALTTSRFAIRELEVKGAKRLSPDQIRTLAGIELGKNLFSFDTRGAEIRLLQDPWVKSARVTRKLPNTLAVELGERDAVAVAVLGDQPYLLTSEGEPFKALEVDDPSDLPVVTGVEVADLARDRAGAEERLRSGIDLLRQYERLSLAKVHPAQEVNLAPTGQTVLTVGQKGITFVLGRPPYARKLAMAADVVGQLAAKGRVPGIVFLDNEAHPERVVVRMK